MTTIRYRAVEGGVQVTRTCVIDNQEYTHVLRNATIDQVDAWCDGAYVQDALPDTPAEDREFLISGISPEKRHEHFGGEDAAPLDLETPPGNDPA